MPDELQRTPLYGRHAESGGRLVPFAGWEMPVQYAGVIDEVRAVRTRRRRLRRLAHGPAAGRRQRRPRVPAGRALERSRSHLAGEAQYTLLTNERGGIVDDLIAYRRESGYLLVVNAGNRHADLAHLAERCPAGATLVDDSDAHGMLALQGPAALALLAPLCEGIDPLEAAPFTFAEARVAGVPCTVARTGYTGEPGVELICPATELVALWDALIDGRRRAVRARRARCPAARGLLPAARQRHQRRTRTPSRPGLGWVCARDKAYRRLGRPRAHAGGRARAPARRAAHGRGARRAAPRLRDRRRRRAEVGVVTSGTFSPTLQRGIGLAYVPSALAEPETPVVVDVRGRPRAAHTARKPLYVKEN